MNTLSFVHCRPRRYLADSRIALSSQLWRIVVLLLIFLARPASAQMIDLNGDGMSDVWQQIYGATGLAPEGDADGDGVSNLQEAAAGTNPFDSNSYPHITVFGPTPTNFSVTIPCQLGKIYQLQSIPELGSVDWLIETSQVARAGSTITFTAPGDPSGKFFRIAIADLSSDGSGMNDWEKYKLGLDPLNPYSNGNLDNNGQLLTDYAYATNGLASQNVFTILAADPVTTQPDPGSSATDLGMLTVTRAGFPLNAVTVSVRLGGPGPGFAVENVDHAALPRSLSFSAGVSSVNVPVTPLVNSNLAAPVIAQMQLLPSTNNAYTLGANTNASVVIYPSPTANGSGLMGYYYTNSNTTFTNAVNFNPTNLFLTRLDPVIDFTYTNGTVPNLSNGLYSVRWTGQILPQYSETYFFDVRSDDGVRLTVGDQLVISDWRTHTVADVISNVTLQAGTRYNLKLEYLQTGTKGEVHLSWYSASQPKQIIPSNRLYPTNTFGNNSSNAPAIITSALSAVAFLGQPFSFTVTAANTSLGYTATGLPPGLGFNNTNGLISGIPTLAGNYPVTLTASNAVGVGASLVNIRVFDTGSSVVREVWTNVPGATIADIPVGAPASFTNTLGTLEGITNFGSNYGERVRGYFTAPVTGNYYFWLAASDAAELWISDDGEVVNQLRRSYVLPAGGGTGIHIWNTQTNQQTKWLTLVAGQKYFVQVLHKAGATAPDHWSVGWLQDPNGTNTAPSGIVPGYLLARYYPLPISAAAGTLYTANLLALPGAVSDGVGSASLQVNAAGTQAILSYTFTNLVGTPTGQAIDSDPYLNNPAELIFDISAAKVQPNGTYVWNIKATGPLQTNDIREIIAQGKAVIVIESSKFPNGEIGGHFTLANGSQTFTPGSRHK